MNRTLARDLMIGLSLSITVAISIFGTLYYFLSTRTAKQQLMEKTVTTTNELSKVIAPYQWDLETDAINQIVKVYLQSDYIIGIRVRDEAKGVIVDEIERHEPDAILRKQAITFENNRIGTLEVMFTRQVINESQKLMVNTILFSLISILLVIFIATHFIMKYLLRRPMGQLIDGIRKIASGDYQYYLEKAPQKDINYIIAEINQMAQQIFSRAEQLRQEIRERQSAQKALQDSEEKYRNLFEAAPEGIVIMDFDGTVYSCNQTFKRYLKTDQDLCSLGLNARQFFAFTNEQWQDLIFRLKTESSIEGLEHSMLDTGNQAFPIGMALKRINYDGTDCIQALVRDITTRKKMEQDLKNYAENLEGMVEEKTKRLKEANQELSEVIKNLEQTREQLAVSAHQAGMAEIATSVLHNIGNAINTVNVRTKKLDDLNRERDIQYLEKIHDIALNMDQMNPQVKQAGGENEIAKYLSMVILIFKKRKENYIENVELIKKGIHHIIEIISLQQRYAGIKGFAVSVNINDLMVDALEMLKDSLKKRNIETQLDLGELPLVRVDKNKLVQIFINGIKNAYEAIDLAQNDTSALENDKKIMIATRLDNASEKNMIQIRIQDTGIGFADDIRDKLFQFNFSTKGRGTGFGLHDAANYINAIYGSMDLFSQGPQKGAKLTIKIPVEIPE